VVPLVSTQDSLNAKLGRCEGTNELNRYLSFYQPFIRSDMASLKNSEEIKKFSLVQENIVLNCETVVTGTVRVEKLRRSQISRIACPIKEGTVSIERIQKNEHVDEEYEAKLVDGTWIIPVFEYVPITYNQLVLKEEVHVTTMVSESVAEIDVPVDIQHVKVSRKKVGEDDWTLIDDFGAEPEILIKR
jgi:stress response protein YsnF